LLLAANDASPITVGTPAWFNWLEGATSFAFSGPAGSFTAHKENRARGGWYWKAYRTVHGKMRRFYLGKAADLTLERLNHAAATLAASLAAPLPPLAPEIAVLDTPAQLLATKLFVPSARATLVPRLPLIERLNEGLQRKLTLISAPAGFGKTTLLSAWLSGCDRPAAWLSLDEGDNDPTRFLIYLVAALRTIAPNIGAELLAVLQSPQPPPTKTVLTALLNEISAIADIFVLVLDDYHRIEAKAVDDALAFLLEHLPAQMHLVIATREDPPLPLARLRARDELTELRVTDLRFSPAEAAAFLNQAMGLDLAAEDIEALETRTEGWIAGLQLAALSLRGRADIRGFIKAFSGDNRYIVDYLVAEVLQQQPEAIRNFLLQTSILERLSGPLCAAVTGQPEGQARLEALERGNFFVVPLDDQRHWYRYHHLFGAVLYTRLMVEQPGQGATLHRRASEWYERNGSAADAIRHALAARDFARAADLVELEWRAMRRSRQEAPMLGWLKALPDEVLHCRPVLSVGYAHVLLAGGELAGVEDRLRDAERWLDTPNPSADMRALPHTGSAAMVVVDEEAFRRLPGTIAVARAGQAMALGNVPGTIKYARLVLDLVPLDDHFSRGAAAAFLGLASWLSGDLEAAHRSYAAGVSHLQMAGHTADAINGAITLADIRMAQGRLHDAMRTYERGLQLATAHGEHALRGTADMYVGMSALLRERNDLDAATQHLLRSKEQGEHSGFPQNRYRWRVAMARIREAQGDLDGALDLLGAAERLYMSGLRPSVRPIAALKTRMWVAQGRLAEALDWAHAQGLSAQDDLSYLREFEHLTLARVLLARYQSDGAAPSIHAAMALLGRLLQAAEAGERGGSVVEILVLQALAHQAQGDMPAARTALERALALAEPEGYVRIFIDEGAPMRVLLREAAARGIRPDYTGTLLPAFEAEQPPGSRPELGAAQEPPGRSAGEPGLHPPPSTRSDASQLWVEPLSQRELAVLRLFQTELTGPEIARELVIALSTLRTHTKGLYSKLNVNNRRAAVKQAAELNLIKPR
jgi:LuxR family maltose regulon positive regulatory protein